MKKLLSIIITIVLLSSVLLITNTAVSCTICDEEEKFDCNKWSTNDTMVSLNKSTWPLLDKTASVNAFLVNRNCVKPYCDCVCNEDNLCHCIDTEDSYTNLCAKIPDRCCCCIKPGILTHRGTRGLGVLTGSNDDEIDAIGSYEGIVVKFKEPVLIKQIQIRSLFQEKYNGQEVNEQCDILTFNGCNLVGRHHITGTEPIGTGNGIVNVTNVSSSMTDRIDMIIFFVNPFRLYARYSDFAVAKILTNLGNISFVQPLEGVDCTNQHPVAVDDEAKVLENSEGNKIDVLANDYDPDGDKLTIASIDTPSNGEAKIKDRFIEYTPNKDFTGIDSFRYKIVDGNGGEDDACVKILVEDVNKPPVAEDDYINIAEDSNGVTIDVLANDSDPDGDSIFLSHVGDPSHGVISIISEKILYIPESDYHGSDSFEYEICDGNDEFDTATVHITITPVNDQPEVSDIPDQTVDEGETFVDINLDEYVTDVEDSDSDIEWTFSGNSELIVNIVDRVATITIPDENWNGQETIVFTATDTGGLSDSDDATFTVESVNDAPVANNDSVVVDEDCFVVIDVLANDFDVEDGVPMLSEITVHPEHGTAVIEGSMVNYTPDPDYFGTDLFTYKVVDSDGLIDTATVSIQISGVNDAPVANDDYMIVEEGGTVDVLVGGADSVLDNDSDVDGDELSVSLTCSPSYATYFELFENGTFVYTHDGSEYSTDIFSYTVFDGNGGNDTATVTITINPINDAPIVGDIPDQTILEGETFSSFDLDDFVEDEEDSDEDIQWSYSGNSVLMINIDENNVVTITIPDENWNGQETIVFTATDTGGLSDSDDATFTVESVNDAPVANDDSVVVDEDCFVVIDVLANDFDVEDGVPMLSEITVHPEHGTAVIEGGMVNYTPDPDYFGTDLFTYKINDTENLNDTANVTIQVLNINDAPVANDDYMIVEEGGTVDVLVGGADSVLDNDSDVDGDELSVSLTCSPSYATYFELFENGTFVYTHDGSEYSTDIFSYTVFDGHGGNDTATVTVTIEHEEDEEEDDDEDQDNNGGGGNSRPKRPSSYNNKPNAVITPSETIHVLINEEIELNGSQSSDDGSIKNYTWNLDETTKKYGETITHSYDTANIYTVTLTVKDNLGKTDSASVKIVVSEPNHPPAMPTVKVNGLPAQNKIETIEGRDIHFELVSTDEDGDQIKYLINWGDENTENSELMNSGDALAVIHNWSEPGDYKIKIQAMDDQNAPSEIHTIDLTVKENKNQIGEQPDDVDKDEQTSDDDKKDKETGTFPWWILILIIIIAIIIGLIIYFWWKKPNYIPQVIQPT